MKNDFVTKTDLKEALEEFAGQIISAMDKGFKECATKTEFKHLEKKVDSLEVKVDSISSDVKDIKRRVTDLEADLPSNSEIQNHEKRITKLEKKVYLPSSL